jgi:hypothetical protein
MLCIAQSRLTSQVVESRLAGWTVQCIAAPS